MKREKIVGAILVFSLMFNMATITKASPSIEENKKKQEENLNKINGLQNESKANKNEMNALNDEITKLTKMIFDKNMVIGEKERSLEVNEKAVGELQGKIKTQENKIQDIQKSIDEKVIEEKEKEVLLGKRLRAIYKGNPYSEMFMVLVESKGISDLISRVENISKIVNYDKKLISEVSKIRDELNSYKNIISSEKMNLEKEKGNLDILNENLKRELSELNKSKNELDNIQNMKNSKISSLSDKNKEIANLIVNLEESNEEIEKDIQRIIAQNTGNNGGQGASNNKNDYGSVNNGGKWIYPVNAGITSPFGYRTHPVTGGKKLHTGTDFGAAYGTPVKAVGNGRVILASSYGGYGNAVMIDHGNGTVTLYGHNSKLNVSEGQTVKQGQIVSYVGSTGVSTGAHLHLEFRVNGQPVDPMKYLN